MGKIGEGNSSWLNVVKRAFRYPTKDSSSKRREEREQEEDEKKKGKRRWMFSKPCIYETTIVHHKETKNITATPSNSSSNSIVGTSAAYPKYEANESEERRAIALAEAAIAAAQAAMEVIRLARSFDIATKYYAAIIIQKAFKGYLARRALRALKGIVRLQALARGDSVRKRAKMTLSCFQSLVRVQAQVREQSRRLSYERNRGSTSSESNSLREFHLETKNSTSREGGSTSDEPASKREKELSSAFSRQMRRSGKDQFLGKEGREEKPRWSDQAIKTVDIDTAKSYSYLATNSQGSQNPHYHFQQQKSNSDFGCSPLHRTNRNLTIPSPVTPFPSRIKPVQVHSASPRCLKEERSSIMAQTLTIGCSSIPNYMAATASAKARFRSQSAPRQRPSTPEREKTGSAKKRLSFPATKSDNGVSMSDMESELNLSSPSCKTIHGGYFGRSKSNMYCCCEDSHGE